MLVSHRYVLEGAGELPGFDAVGVYCERCYVTVESLMLAHEDAVVTCPEDCCEWCGEPFTEGNPIVQMIVSPPVSGYDVHEMRVHRACGDAAARAEVE